jgi:hypothetical protein
MSPVAAVQSLEEERAENTTSCASYGGRALRSALRKVQAVQWAMQIHFALVARATVIAPREQTPEVNPQRGVDTRAERRGATGRVDEERRLVQSPIEFNQGGSHLVQAVGDDFLRQVVRALDESIEYASELTEGFCAGEKGLLPARRRARWTRRKRRRRRGRRGRSRSRHQ